MIVRIFQSTLRRTERHFPVITIASSALFQSTLRRTERPCHNPKQIVSHQFQSTLRRTERHMVIQSLFNSSLFQSTLRRTERRGGAVTASCLDSLFQSTLRRTERLVKMVQHWHQVYISIHAPTNGATATVSAVAALGEFQSTLRRTERPRSTPHNHTTHNFNPRSDERSDQLNYSYADK